MFGAAKPSLFGTSSTSAAAANKPLFGATPATSSTNSLFGGSQTTQTATAGTLFGASQPAAPTTGGGLFGGTTATTAAGTLFGASAPITSQPPPLFGAAAPAAGGLFGATSQPAATGLFGAASTSTATGGLFGAKPAANTFSLFGGAQTQQPAATAPSAFAWGQPNAAQNTLAMQQQQQQVMAAAPGTPSLQLLEVYQRALKSPLCFGDERDEVIAKLNQLQAKCGMGKAYHTADQPPHTFELDNAFCRFQAIVLNNIPTNQDEDGLVGLVIRQAADKVKTQTQVVEDSLFKVMGGRPTLKAHVLGVTELPGDRCEVTLYVSEQSSTTGSTRRITANELCTFLGQNTQWTQLQQLLAADSLHAKVGMDKVRLAQYLAQVPAGIAPIIWSEAKADNPSPETLIPWPVRGFKQLNERYTLQHSQAVQHNKQLEVLGGLCSNLQANCSNVQNRQQQLTAKHDHLSQRLLKLVSVHLQRTRSGYSLSQTEELLQTRMEHLYAALAAPNGVKSAVNELLTISRCQPELLASAAGHASQLEMSDECDPLEEDKPFAEEIHQILNKSQRRVEMMLQTVRGDMKCLQVMQGKLGAAGGT